MGTKLKENQNKGTINESNIVSQAKSTNLRQKKGIEKDLLIHDGIDITGGSISDDEETIIRKAGETKAIKKVFSNIY